MSGFCLGILLAAVVRSATGAEAIDPAVVGERLQRLTAAVESLEMTLASQQRQIDGLANELQKAREELANHGNQRPWADDMKRLADAINEVDRKRAADGEQVLKVLNELRRSVATSTTTEAPRSARPSNTAVDRTAVNRNPGRAAETTPDKALPYVIQAGDSLSRVVDEFNKQARQEGYQALTVQQVMKFNNIAEARRIREGQTIQLPVIPK
jgi:LysM repeat protein